MTLMTYDDVIESLNKKKRQHHLLMGNGFSMAYDPKIFSYNALHQFVEKVDNDLLSKLFDVVKTKNFEIVMQQLNNFCELITAFGSEKDSALLEQVQAASNDMKTSLIKAVKELHPEHVFKISDEEHETCAKFLNQYLENGGKVFTTNYDTLLYWVLMRNNIVNHVDGFGRDREDDEEDFDTEPEYSELRWGKHRDTQNTFYLHGALPIFDAGISIVKEQYDTENYLLEKIEKRMAKGDYPVFVAAGGEEEKLRHIMHNRYLTYCYEQLCNIEGSLVTFGFNFGEYDRHIIGAINAAAKHGKKIFPKLNSVYIGVYSDDDKKHIESISYLFQCKVNMFDATTAKVWR